MLAADDRDTFLALEDAPELELVHTSGDAVPRLEPQALEEDHVTIHEIGPRGGSVFWVTQARRLEARAQEIAQVRAIDFEAVWRGLVFAYASEGSDSDGFVTERDYILAGRSSRDPCVYNASEALALAGLALRLHGNRRIGRDLLDQTLSDSWFNFVVARDLLRAGWRWFSACVSHATASGDETSLNLGEAALERFQRVLQIRDRLHAQAKVPQHGNDGGDELLFQFETFLLFLAAAFDAAARVAHLVYIGRDYEEAGWRRVVWRQKLARAAPRLAAITDDGTAGAALLQLISRLRNTIHGEAMRPIQVRGASGRNDYLTQLSADEAAKLRARITVLGEAPRRWGLKPGPITYLAVDRYAEALLPHAVRLMNVLMAATEVERLPGVDPTRLMAPPPDVPSPDAFSDPFSYEVRRRVRKLSGL